MGSFEAFFTDGVRTLHHTISAKNIWEKTLRYKGHAEKIKFLIKLGLLSKERLKTVPISPWEFMWNFWTEKLSFFEEKDVLLIRVTITGRKASTRLQHTFEIVDFFDEKRNITTMGRTTAYPAFAVIKLLTENKIKERGVIPPKILGMNPEIFQEIENLLKERNIQITKRLRQLE